MEQKQEVMIIMLHGAGHNSDDNAIGRFNTAVHYFIKKLNTNIIIVH